MSPKHNEIIETEIEKILDAGIIAPASSAWSFPIVIASEKDGKPGFFVDYHALNQVIKADQWPFPKIEELFDDLVGINAFTALDIFSGY